MDSRNDFEKEIMDLLSQMDEKTMARFQMEQAMADEDYEELKELLDAYEEQFGRDLFFYMMAIDRMEMSEESERMKELIDEATAELGEDPNLELRYARYYFFHTQYEKALEHANKAYETGEREGEFYMLLQHLRGFTFVILHQYEEAARCLEDVLMDFYDPRTALIAGLVYHKIGREDRFEEYVTKAMEDAPNDDEELIRTLRMFNNNLDDIRQGADTLLYMMTHDEQIDEEFMDSFKEEFIRFLIQEHPDELVKGLKRLSEADSFEGRLTTIMLGDIHKEKGETAKAKNLWRKVLNSDLDPESSDASAELYLRLDALDRLNYTQSTMRKWKKQLFQSVLPHYHLADLLAKDAAERFDTTLMRDYINLLFSHPAKGKEKEAYIALLGYRTYCAAHNYLEALNIYDLAIHPDQTPHYEALRFVLAALSCDDEELILNEPEDPGFDFYDVLAVYYGWIVHERYKSAARALLRLQEFDVDEAVKEQAGHYFNERMYEDDEYEEDAHFQLLGLLDFFNSTLSVWSEDWDSEDVKEEDLPF